MKVTIKDVAKEANVAVSTVSRVISNNSRISVKTKLKVWDAIKKLNYTPNQMARGLATQKTNIIAVILPEWINGSFLYMFIMQVFKGISSCAKEKEYFIMYAFKEDEDNWISKFVQSNFVEGIILFHDQNEKGSIEYLKNIEFPFVSVGLPRNLEESLKVDSKEEIGMLEANGKYLGNYAMKIIVDILENKQNENYYSINTKFISNEPVLEKIKGMFLYNRYR